MVKAGKQIVVLQRAALARVRRVLAKQPSKGWTLHTARSDRMAQSVGARYWAVDVAGNYVAHKWDSLADLVSWCEVLKPWEVLETSD